MHVILEEFVESKRGQTLDRGHRQIRFGPPRQRSRINTEEEDAVAVVGMGCLFPGALDVERFWDLLTSGRDPKQAVPPDRWRLEVVHSLSV